MEEVELPSHFLCPISLQLMRDPVTISTGITYDRESIEKWLYTCKNLFCPVTKQVLVKSPFDDIDDHNNNMLITPNHTLRRLIQSWCTLHASDGVERIPTPKLPVTVNRAYVTKLISDAKKSTTLRYTCLQSIRSIVGSCEVRAKKILESSGAFEYVGLVLIEEGVNEMRDKEEALSILALLDGDESVFKWVLRVNDHYELFLRIIIGLLRSGCSQVRENAIKVLKFVYKIADPNQLSNVTFDMIREVVNVVKDNFSSQATKCALKLLVELNPWGRNRVKVVEAGAVHVLVEMMLVDGSDRRSSEFALVVLDQLCGCAEGRADLVGHGAGLAIVSKKILRVSHVASDRAVRILSSISRYLATTRVLVEMMEVGVVAKLCLIIQVDCSTKTKERAKEMLRLHSRVWKMSPCIPPHLISSYPST